MTKQPIVNISRSLTELAESQPETPAIIFPSGNRTLTYRQLDDESNLVAAGLVLQGISRGTRTAVLIPPSQELFIVTFALFKAGAVPVFIDPGIGAKNMKGCLNNAEPSAFIGIPKAHLARRLFGWGKQTIRISIVVNGSRIWGGIPLETVKENGNSEPFAAADTTSDETAAILFTSGSTGSPKGVVYTHGNFTAQVDALKSLYNIRNGEIDIPTFPLFALFAPALGMTAIIPEMDFTKPGNVNPINIISLANNYTATTMFGSPALLDRVGRYSQIHKEKIPSMKRVISAGAPVQPKVLERFSSLLPPDAEIFTPYGATEALPVSSIGSREILSETGKLAGEGWGICVGKPVEGISLAIIPISDEPIAEWDDELPLPLAEVGEIIVKGEQVTKAYFNNPTATRLAKIRDPDGGFWHRMGDLGYLDSQGRIWFCGRKAHRVVTSKETLFTITVEGVFNKHKDVYRTALVGIGNFGDQNPVLCVEPEKGVSKSDYNRICKELMEIGSKYPHTRGVKEILFHTAFPVDIRHNAKIFREKLAVWAAGRLK